MKFKHDYILFNYELASDRLKGSGRRAVLSHEFVRGDDGTWRPLVIHFHPNDLVFVSKVLKWAEDRRVKTKSGVSFLNEKLWDGPGYEIAVVVGQLEDSERFGVMLPGGEGGFCDLPAMRKAERSFATWLDNVPVVGD